MAAHIGANLTPQRRPVSAMMMEDDRARLVQEVLGWLAGLQYLLRPGWRLARVDRPTK